MSNLHEHYRQTSIQTAPPEQLIVMLYDGAIRFLEQAKASMQDGRDFFVPMGKAQDIVVELISSLNHSAGAIATQLNQLYDFWIYRLGQATAKKDPAMVDEVLFMLRELRESWSTVVHQKKATVASKPAAMALNARG